MNQDSAEYLKKKEFFDRILTVYGRNPVYEAISDKNVQIFRLHLSESNKPAKVLDNIINLCRERGAEVLYHSKRDLSRISKNAKQDQGIAVDLKLKYFYTFDKALQQEVNSADQYIALDGITNPQNLGMIIRSVCASPLKGLILPKSGCAKIDSLVIKASTGTLFRTPIFQSNSLVESLKNAKDKGFEVIALDVNASTALKDYHPNKPCIFVLGNETEGLSSVVQKQCDKMIRIPMCNNVESLNVAITASLLAFRSQL